MATIKWTQEMRHILYTRLKEKYGIYDGEPKRFNPKLPKNRLFSEAVKEELIKDHKTYFTIEAVAQQIDWGITKQRTIPNSRLFATWILNKAAAMDAGFLRRDDLPQEISIDNKK